MILEEYNTDELILIGMPLEKLPLNCDGLPLIVKKIYDYIIDYGAYLFELIIIMINVYVFLR